MKPRPMSEPVDNRAYYDDFAGWYERQRGYGYHQMLDDLEVELVRRYGHGRDVLEVGCGTGLLLERIAGFAAHAVGADLSAGMLAHARARQLEVVQASASELPFADASFDVVCSFKVLAHVREIEHALAEMARVTRPGGWVLAEFYNTRSLRYLVKSLKPPTAISATTSDEAVYTRYDAPGAFRRYLPATLTWRGMRGIRIITPVAAVHRVPLVGGLTRVLERRLADVPLARSLGGFAVAIAQRSR